MVQRWYPFFRPTLFVLACFTIALAISHLVTVRNSGQADPPLGLTELDGLKYPDPTMKPRDVVRVQLAALCDENGAAGILQCYCFASPANRSVTGPLERFGRMVRQRPYNVLTNPRAVLVGQPQYVDERARVLVTVVDKHAQLQMFVFVLEKQTLPDFAGCWMTEGVFPVSTRIDGLDTGLAPSEVI